MDRRARASEVGTLGTPARHAARLRRHRVRRRARRRGPGRRLRRGRSGPGTSAVFSSRRLRDDERRRVDAGDRRRAPRRDDAVAPGRRRDVDGSRRREGGGTRRGANGLGDGSRSIFVPTGRETSTRRRGPDGSRLVALAAVSSVRRWRWGVPRRAPAADRVGRRGDAARASARARRDDLAGKSQAVFDSQAVLDARAVLDAGRDAARLSPQRPPMARAHQPPVEGNAGAVRGGRRRGRRSPSVGVAPVALVRGD